MHRASPAALVAVAVASTAALPAGAVVPSVNVATGEYYYAPSSFALTVGQAAQFDNAGSDVHTATAQAPFKVFDTGPIAPAGNAVVTFGYAGVFPFFCEFHGSQRGTARIAPDADDAGTVGSPLLVRYATSAPPSGKGIDLQIRSGTGRWRDWKIGRKGTQVSFTPSRPGIYEFRARMRKLRNDKHTAWSPADASVVS